MIRMGATGSPAHLDLCRALETVFRRNGVEFDWVLYSGYDEMVDAFTRGEINLAWNGPLSHVKMRRAMPEGAPVLALRDVDIGFTTRFITRADSAIDTVEDLPGTRFAFAARTRLKLASCRSISSSNWECILLARWRPRIFMTNANNSIVPIRLTWPCRY
ncbi:MAG: PhnD/SsuA/transferrin family substrate-binding protein [Chloroflexi bacterium]|nr:PhnD/SsuA/transferrin family substrate-binding protein [Chloroflexota bacterium]